MFLSVAIVIDDPVDHVSRPVDVRLVSHHRHIVLAVLVTLLVCFVFDRLYRKKDRKVLVGEINRKIFDCDWRVLTGYTWDEFDRALKKDVCEM